MSSLSFVIGGARSGKSRFAEGLAKDWPHGKTYIATAEPFDGEMRERIARHQMDRAADGWRTVEAPLALAEAIRGMEVPVLVDCITVWLGNLMHHGLEIPAAVEGLCAAVAGRRFPTVIVSNEVGLSVVPENAMARRFRDEQGRANQRLAAIADDVFFVAAGLPLKLKG